MRLAQVSIKKMDLSSQAGESKAPRGIRKHRFPSFQGDLKSPGLAQMSQMQIPSEQALSVPVGLVNRFRMGDLEPNPRGEG